jgi:uncharacterized protein (TIGR00730 family)
MHESRFRAVKAYENGSFLQSPDARALRILSEYLEPETRFDELRIRDTIVFFGSARILPRDVAETELATAEKDGRNVEEAKMKLAMSRYYEDARELARRLTQWSKGLSGTERRFVVCSGGGPGIMEAANRGASEAGGKTIGLNIRLPFEQGANPYITQGLHFEFHYFFMRKFWFAYLAKSLVIFPGGFGTCDELFELLTLAQTDKLSKKIGVILYGREYWDKVFDFGPMVEWGAIAEEDLSLMHHADSPAEAFEFLRNHLVEHHLESGIEQEAAAPGIAKTRG